MVGIQKLSSSPGFTVYPVPNNGEFTASINTTTDATFTIMVYNQLGSKLFELTDVKTTGGKSDTRIDLGSVNEGVYFIAFRNGPSGVVRKFFVTR